MRDFISILMVCDISDDDDDDDVEERDSEREWGRVRESE